MKESKALMYVTRRNIQIDLDREYNLYANEVIRDRHHPNSPSLRYEKTQDVGSQYDYKRDNINCTCKNLGSPKRKRDVRYFGSPKQVYAYHERSRSFTDIGIGSVKALLKKKVQRVYLPETDDRGCGSSELSSYFRKEGKDKQQKASSYYESKRTSSKCVGGLLAYNTGRVMSEKLSPIIQKVSESTSPQESANRNIEIGSNTVNKILTNTTTQMEELIDREVGNKMENEVIIKTVEVSPQLEKVKIKIMNSVDMRNSTKERKYKPPEKFSSDSLVQHVHDLENPSEIGDKQSRCSEDFMENKLEREYRKIFTTKSKDCKKPNTERRLPDNKSASILKRRFEALRRGLARKDESKKSAMITPKMSSQISMIATSHRDVSINSDPPSLEARSFSNTKIYSPHAFPSIVEHDKSNIYNPQASYKRAVTREQQERASVSWSKTDEEDSECQGVRGMFKLWGKKFNFEEDVYKASNISKPSFDMPKSSERKNEYPKMQTKSTVEEKEKKKFFFFKKKNKEEKKEKPFKPKKDVTAGRCEVKEGLMIKIGNVDQAYKSETRPKTPEKKRKLYDAETGQAAWLQKYLSRAIESRNSVKIRWNNKMYGTSSSTVFELMDNVYRDTGVVFRSKSEMTVQSSYYKPYSRRHIVNYAQQNIEAWMIPKTITDYPQKLPAKIKRESNKPKNENMEVRISDQKWFIDKSKAFSHKIEVVLLSKNLVRCNKKESSEYLRIDIPKGFFVNSSETSDDNKQNQSSDEEVYKIVEYETASDLKKEKNVYRYDKDQNNIKVTVSVRSHRNLDPRCMETVIKTPPVHRDVIIQNSKVFIPKRCEMVGVGIITQREMRERGKPILTIQGISDEESDHDVKLHLKKCEFAESYLQEYYRHWAPTAALDSFSWCVSDSHLRCCSEPSKTSFNNQGDVTKSCPNILEDYQTIVSSCETSHSSRRACYEEPDGDNGKSSQSSPWYKKRKCGGGSSGGGKNSKSKDPDPNALKRVLPKDSIEVFKRRKIYAASMKSKWNTCVFGAPCPDHSTDSVINDCTSPKVAECPATIKPCWKPCERSHKKKCAKHVSLPNCEDIRNLNKPPCEPEGILAFKGATSDDNKKKGRCTVNPEPSCHIVPPPCEAECQLMKKPFCQDSKIPCDELAKHKCTFSPCTDNPPCATPCRIPPCVGVAMPCPKPPPPPCVPPRPSSPCASPPKPKCPSPPKPQCPPPPKPPCSPPPPCTPPPPCPPPPKPPCTPPPKPPCSPPPKPACTPPPKPPCTPPPQSPCPPPRSCSPPPKPPCSPPPKPPCPKPNSPCPKPKSPCTQSPKPKPCSPPERQRRSPPPCPTPPSCPSLPSKEGSPAISLASCFRTPSPPSSPARRPCETPPPCKSPPPCEKPRKPPPCPKPKTPPSQKPPPPCPKPPPPSQKPPPPCPKPKTPPCPKPKTPPCQKPHPPCQKPIPACQKPPPCPKSLPPCQKPPPPCFKPPPPCLTHIVPCCDQPCTCIPPSSPSTLESYDPPPCQRPPPPCQRICPCSPPRNSSPLSQFSSSPPKCPHSAACYPISRQRHPIPKSTTSSKCSCSHHTTLRCPNSPFYTSSPVPPPGSRCARNPLSCPASPPPCAGKSSKKKKKSASSLPKFFKGNSNPASDNSCSPTYSVISMSYSCSSMNNDEGPAVPFQYSKVHPCPPDYCERPTKEEQVRRKMKPCRTCGHTPNESSSPPAADIQSPSGRSPPAVMHPCAQCRASCEDFSNKSATVYNYPQISVNKFSSSCTNLSGQLLTTASVLKPCEKKSCPNHPSNTPSQGQPKMQCPPPKNPSPIRYSRPQVSKSRTECSPNCPDAPLYRKPSPPSEYVRVPVTPPSPQSPRPTVAVINRSKPKVTGVHLRISPSRKACDPGCPGDTTVKPDLPETCFDLSSDDKITIRLKKETPSTEEIREGLNIKVQDEDGRTLFERRDYVKGSPAKGPDFMECTAAPCDVPTRGVLGDVYKNSYVHRMTTPMDGQVDYDNLLSEDRSNTSIANTIEIQFKVKVTQGDKSTEINIASDDVNKSDIVMKDQKLGRAPQDVYVLKDEDGRPEEKSEGKNDINIRIVIKNFKPKSAKAKYERRCDYCADFAKQISAKFHSVSTGYSDIAQKNVDHVFSIHRATVDLTSSVEKSKTQSRQSEDTVSEPYTEHEPDKIVVSSRVTEESICICMAGEKHHVIGNGDMKIVNDKNKINFYDTQEETDAEKQETDNERPETEAEKPETDTEKQETDIEKTKNDTKIHETYKENVESDTERPEKLDTDTEKPETDTEKLKNVVERYEIDKEKSQIDPELHETYVERLETDADRPETDNERPETDTERPETDTERPETDTERPETDIERPETDIERQETDTERPETDIERPETDIERPETDIEKQETDTERPETDTERLETDTERPEIDGDKPETDTEKPETDTEKPETDTEKLETDTDKLDTDTEKRSERKFDTILSTDTDDPENYDAHDTGSLEIIKKPRTKEEKKEIMKTVFEKAHNVKKNKIRMKKLRDMLKVILTSDSSEPEDLKLTTTASNNLAKDVTYASLRPNYFRDSDSMNNYFTVENNVAISERDLKTNDYPTGDNNSVGSKTSSLTSDNDTPPAASCMCNTVAERLKMASRMCGGGGGCCCGQPKSKALKSAQICCDIKQESDDTPDDEVEPEYVDVETQNSRYLTSKVTSTDMILEGSIKTNLLRMHIQEEPLKDSPQNNSKTSSRYLNPYKRSFSPNMNHVRECEMRKLNRNTILRISGEDKIVMLSSKPTRTSSDGVKAKVYQKKIKDDNKSLAQSADILQSYETKKAVLEIYTERDVSNKGERLVAKLPKFVYDTESDIYNAISTNSYVCKNNIIMMTINR